MHVINCNTNNIRSNYIAVKITPKVEFLHWSSEQDYTETTLCTL